MAFCSLSVLHVCNSSSARAGGFPCTAVPCLGALPWQQLLSSKSEITPCFSAPTLLYFSRRHVPFGSSFRHPDVSPFSFLWNFFCLSLCRVLGFGSWALVGRALPMALALGPFPRVLSWFHELQGSSAQGPQESHEILATTSTIHLPTWGTDRLEMSPSFPIGSGTRLHAPLKLLQNPQREKLP